MAYRSRLWRRWKRYQYFRTDGFRTNSLFNIQDQPLALQNRVTTPPVEGLQTSNDDLGVRHHTAKISFTPRVCCSELRSQAVIQDLKARINDMHGNKINDFEAVIQYDVPTISTPAQQSKQYHASLFHKTLISLRKESANHPSLFPEGKKLLNHPPISPAQLRSIGRICRCQLTDIASVRKSHGI